jgi:AAHS family cis,cis-muconate transporter-like MFS transporter
MSVGDSREKMDLATKRIIIAMFMAMIVDGINLQLLSLALPSIMKELKLSNLVGGALGAWSLAGMGAGGILGGWLSDRVGRVRVCLFCVIMFSISTGCTAFCNTYWQIVFFRFIAGAGIGAVYGVCMTLISEYIPTEWRATVLGTMQGGWSLGYVVAGIMSAYIQPAYGWRALFLASVVPGAISVAMLMGLKDAPSYLASRNAVRQSGVRQNEYAKMWADKPVRYTFIAWCFASIALQFGYYGANTWLPSYLAKDLGVNLKNAGWFVASAYGAMVFGKIGAGYLGDQFGRRVVWLFAGIGSAVVLPVIVHYATPTDIAFLLILFGLLCGAPYGVNGAYMSESFPTAIRGTCLATAHNVGRVGAISAPLMIGAVSAGYSIGLGIALLGIAYLICGLIPPIFIREKVFDPKSIEESVHQEAGTSFGVNPSHEVKFDPPVT